MKEEAYGLHILSESADGVYATPTVLYFIEGQAEVQLGEDKVNAQPGSFVYMPPMLPHGISAKTALRMLLVQMKLQLK